MHHVAINVRDFERMLKFYNYDKGYTHLCVESNDMAADYAHLKQCGVDFTGRDWLEMNDVKAVYGYDPEGNIIEIQQCSAASPQRLGLLKFVD